MPIFEISYTSNIEFGQIIQKCECADAFVEVVPRYERDRMQIPFWGALRPPHNLQTTVSATEGIADAWKVPAQRIGTYLLDVAPQRGATHHDFRFVELNEEYRKNVDLQGNMTALITVKISRKESVIYDIPYRFTLDDDLTADGQATAGESGLLAALTNRFSDWPELIPASAEKFGVPKSLILAVAVMETTHGWYDEPLEWVGANKSIRPMNINVAYWPELFSEADMYDPAKNFDAGAFMLKRIIERLDPEDRTVRKIATLYNNINAGSVTDYGARVDVFSRTLRPDWL